MISQRAIDLIVACEVTSQSYYEKHYRHPEWPGGASGVTIGIGYDLGYASLEKLHADWDGRVSDDMLKVMARCLGVKGQSAKKLLSSIRHKIEIPWDAAMAVFLERDIPEWTRRVCNAIPGADKLTPDCLGVIVSIAYNRGASFGALGDRYTEMRAIRQHIIAGELYKVTDDIRSMKRLWPDVKGLRDRRDAEAKLFSEGLTTVTPPPDVEPVETIKETKQPASVPAAVVASGGTAVAAAQQGLSWPVIIMAAVAVAVVVFLVIHFTKRD